MNLDILLLGGTIAVAVGAVIVGLLRAVLERRRAPSLWAQYRSRRIEPERLARAIPGPTATDGSIRALERRAPAIGSRPSYAALGTPVVAEPVPVMAEPVVVLPEPVPLVPEAVAAAVAIPDAAPEAVVAAPEPMVSEPELVEVAPEPVIAAPELVEVAPELVTAAPEPGTRAARSRPTAPEFAWVTPAVAAAMAEPVAEEIVAAVPDAEVESDAGAESAAGAETAAEPTPDIAAAAAPTQPEPETATATAPGPVPLFLPGTYPVAEADLVPGKGDLVSAPAAKATAAMVAGYAPVARAIVRPPEPDGIEDELAYRIGIPGAKRPERPAVIEVAGGQEVVVPVLPTVETEQWPERRNRRRRRAAIVMTALAGGTALAIAVAVLVPNLSLPDSGVLTATGTPKASSDAGLLPQETPTPAPPARPTVVPASAAPVASPSPTASPTPSASAAATDQVKAAAVTPRPQATPRAVAPTPKPKPTAKPTPTPIHLPIALFECSAVGLTISCDGSDSKFAESYEWFFSEGPTQSGARASHRFDLPGSYEVTLTVTNASGSDPDSRRYIVSAP